MRPTADVSRSVLLLVALALVAGVGVRLFRFGVAPPPWHQDEVSAAYDAYAILHYGVDRHGNAFPLILDSWGSGMNALAAYVEMPFLAIGGATPAAARAGQLILCLISLAVFPWLSARLRGRWFGALAACLLAIAPWHILISRWALDENILPLVFLAGVLAQVLADERPWCLPIAYFFFGLALYAHGTAYFTVPVYVTLSSAYLLATGRVPRAAFAAAVAVFVAVAAPVGIYLAINHWQLAPVAIGPFTLPRLTGLSRYGSVAGEPFRPYYIRSLVSLLVRQHDWNSFSAVPGFGLIYLTSLPFVVVGVWQALRDVRPRVYQPEALMLLWLASGCALSFLISANVNRMNILLFPMVYFLARGLEPLRRHRAVFAALAVVYAVQFAAFTRVYFTSYQDLIAPQFFATFDRAIASASASTRGTVCIGTDVNMPYVFVLFGEKYDPREFARTVVYLNPGAEFEWVASFGRYVFQLDHCPYDRAGAVVLSPDEPVPAPLRAAPWTLVREGRYIVARRE